MTRDAGNPGRQDLLDQAADQCFPPCPLDLPQVGRACLGCYEREPGRLQLRFGARDNEGVCDVIVEQSSSEVAVRLLLCSKDDEHLGYPGLAEERTHVYLDRPLGDRKVIDLETGCGVPFFVPTYTNNRLTKAPGYYTSEAEALAAAELQPEDRAQPVEMHGGLHRYRTFGF
jgi:hypothetical protein